MTFELSGQAVANTIVIVVAVIALIITLKYVKDRWNAVAGWFVLTSLVFLFTNIGGCALRKVGEMHAAVEAKEARIENTVENLPKEWKNVYTALKNTDKFSVQLLIIGKMTAQKPQTKLTLEQLNLFIDIVDSDPWEERLCSILKPFVVLESQTNGSD